MPGQHGARKQPRVPRPSRREGGGGSEEACREEASETRTRFALSPKRLLDTLELRHGGREKRTEGGAFRAPP